MELKGKHICFSSSLSFLFSLLVSCSLRHTDQDYEQVGHFLMGVGACVLQGYVCVCVCACVCARVCVCVCVCVSQRKVCVFEGV